MDNFLNLPETDILKAFEEAAARKNVNLIIIEKDFWVCWTLKQLYSIPEISKYITFKGGTSLSKSFGLIERFSEDIDLTISKSYPSLSKIADPLVKNISGKERERRIDALMMNAQDFISKLILPKLYNKFSQILQTDKKWNLNLDDGDKQTILFSYPKINKTLYSVILKNEYIRPIIRLEFGARGDTTPYSNKYVTTLQKALTIEISNKQKMFNNKITAGKIIVKDHYTGK